MPKDLERKTYTVDEAAKLLGIGPSAACARSRKRWKPMSPPASSLGNLSARGRLPTALLARSASIALSRHWLRPYRKLRVPVHERGRHPLHRSAPRGARRAGVQRRGGRAHLRIAAPRASPLRRSTWRLELVRRM